MSLNKKKEWYRLSRKIKWGEQKWNRQAKKWNQVNGLSKKKIELGDQEKRSCWDEKELQ